MTRAYYSHTSNETGTALEAVEEGDTLSDFRGTTWGFIAVTRGPSDGRSAKIKVSDGLGGTREFYASVFPGIEVR